MVQLGQKDILIDCQGNWGNILTGDSAAAPRYIEARLSKFATEVAFNPKITKWQSSYDGRNKEPIFFPIKFPLLLAQGVEGIAVGLSTKILPHNFNELLDGCIEIMKGNSVNIFPDFPTGGIADVSNYNDGLRGGKVRIRAKIAAMDKKTLVITEVPFGTTTGSLIDSILKANDRGKIKIKKIEDNTAEHVEILVHLPPGLSPDKTIDALFAFTDCEVSISPLSCVIFEDKPLFMGVSEILRHSAFLTRDLLKAELEFTLNELEEDWHFASLERIFIENKIYRDIEEAETWDQVISFIHKGLKPHISHLMREVTDDDVARLTEIKIKRISKFDSNKADDNIKALEGKIKEIKGHLKKLTEYTIAWFQKIKEKYGTGRDRKTELRLFDEIVAQKVAIANEKLYVNREEGFVGTSLKKDEFVCECSDLDDVIVFRADGKMIVTKVDQKNYVGKEIIHVAIFKKGDKRTIYNLIYKDGAKGANFMKRFYVDGITRDKEYDLTAGSPNSRILHFSANPNGEAETVAVFLRPVQKLKKLRFDLDFAELAIKGRSSKGNLVSKYAIKKIELKEKGISTLAPRKVWLDESVMRLNYDSRGRLLGQFTGDDKVLEINKNGSYRLLPFDPSTHFDENWYKIEKFNPEKVFSTVYWNAARERYFVKRFIPEVSDKKELFISEDEGSYMEIISLHKKPKIEIEFEEIKGNKKENENIDLEDFIAVKGMKAIGNQLTSSKVKNILLIEEEEVEESESELNPNIEEKPVSFEFITGDMDVKQASLFEDESE